MNRSSKGFGLAGVLATVVFLVVTAVMSASANSTSMDQTIQIASSSTNTQ
jgi:hypothetical protein